MLTKFNVMPVTDKKPLVSWKHLTDKVQPFWEKERVINENKEGTIGIICGPVSNLFVLDDDGSEELKKYHIPRTATVNTPRGGKHYYFKWVKDLDNKVTTRTGVLEKVDTRGYGGYVVWYGWLQAPNVVPLAEPPKWLIDKLPNKTGREIGKPTAVDILKNVSEENHNRNASFTSLAGGLRRDGKNAEYIFEVLKDKAKAVNFSEEELWLVCKSVERYTPNIIEPNLGHYDDQYMSIDKFSEISEVVEWIADEVLLKRGIHFIAGLNGTKKTWAAMDLAIKCAIAAYDGSEQKWLNKFPVRPCKVLYIDQERPKGETKRRLIALLAAQGFTPQQVKDHLTIFCGTSNKIDLNDSYIAFKKKVTDLQPDLIIVDSFATFHTKNENLRQEIQMVLERLKELRNEFGCTFVLLHHENGTAYDTDVKRVDTGQMSGSEAIPAAAEIVFTVRKHSDDTSIVYQTKNNPGTIQAPFMMRVRDVLADKSKIAVEAH